MYEKQEMNLSEVEIETKQIGTAVPLPFHQMLREEAARVDMSLSEFMRMALASELMRRQKIRKRTR